MACELIERINSDLKSAMKARDQKLRVTTLRLINAAIKDRDIVARAEDRCGGLNEDDILALLTKMVKQREDSAQIYEDAGRVELAEQERNEMEIIQAYLPKQLSDDEIATAVDDIIQSIGAEGLKDMGKCMGALKAQYPGAMDFGKANKHVKERLAG